MATVRAAKVLDANTQGWGDSEMDRVVDFGSMGSLLLVPDGGRVNVFALPGAGGALLGAVSKVDPVGTVGDVTRRLIRAWESS